MRPEPGGEPTGSRDPVEVDALRDGTRVRIRPLQTGDRPGVEEFARRLSLEAVELRYFVPLPPARVVEELLGSDRVTGRYAALMETVGPGPVRIVGHAEYVRPKDGRAVAEAAFVIADSFQGRGAATLLLWHLAAVARSEGIRTLETVALRTNAAMLQVCFDAGYPFSVALEEDTVRVSLDISGERQTALSSLADRPEAFLERRARPSTGPAA